MNPYLIALDIAGRARRTAAASRPGSIDREDESAWARDFLATARKLRLAGWAPRVS